MTCCLPHNGWVRVDVASFVRSACSLRAQHLKATDLLKRAIDLVLVFQLQLPHNKKDSDFVSKSPCCYETTTHHNEQ